MAPLESVFTRLIFPDIIPESKKIGQNNVGQKKGETRGKGDGETGRQVDTETRREKAFCLSFSLSPRLPVSPSFCPL
jgi:hypothetical protein